MVALKFKSLEEKGEFFKYDWYLINKLAYFEVISLAIGIFLGGFILNYFVKYFIIVIPLLFIVIFIPQIYIVLNYGLLINPPGRYGGKPHVFVSTKKNILIGTIILILIWVILSWIFLQFK